MTLLERLRDGPLCWDGPIGTRLIARDLDLKREDPTDWNLTHPETVAACHRDDVRAGADVLTTNTFGKPSRAAVDLARAAAGPGRFVLGTIGPAIIDPMHAADVLIAAGVDGLLLETHHFANVLDRATRVASGSPVPVFACLFDWGEDPPSLACRLIDAGICGVGINCAGAEAVMRLLGQLVGKVSAPLLAKPAANGPGVPPLAPETLADLAETWRQSGARLIGACCGGDVRHVAAIARQGSLPG